MDNRKSALVWYWEALEQEVQVLSEDPVPYSVEKMHPTLETFVRYTVEQGLIAEPLALDDLFATSQITKARHQPVPLIARQTAGQAQPPASFLPSDRYLRTKQELFLA